MYCHVGAKKSPKRIRDVTLLLGTSEYLRLDKNLFNQNIIVKTSTHQKTFRWIERIGLIL
jgi:hypothetical protein